MEKNNNLLSKFGSGFLGSIAGGLGSSLISGLGDMFGFGSSSVSRQKDLMNYQNQMNKDFVQFQNAENLKQLQASPVAQLRGMKSAGLNTAMLGGEVSGAVAQSGSSGTAAPSAPDLMQGYAALMNAQSQAKLADAQVGKLNEEEQGLHTENAYKEISIKAGLNEIDSRILDNRMSAALKEIEGSKALVDLDYLRNTLEDRISKVSADLALTEEQKRIAIETWLNVHEDTIVKITQQDVNRAEAKAIPQRLANEIRKTQILGYEAQTSRLLADANISLTHRQKIHLDAVDENLGAQNEQYQAQARKITAEILGAQSESEINEAVAKIQGNVVYQAIHTTLEELKTTSEIARNVGWALKALKDVAPQSDVVPGSFAENWMNGR